MNTAKRSVDDVYVAILERLGTGAFPLGSRLPSCRMLAEDLGSNPSTVSRALQRLAADGLVRTEERRGSFVTATERRMPDATAQITDAVARIVARATSAGLDRAAIEAMFAAALDEASSTATVAFVECNEFDLSRMSQLVENATGVSLRPLLIDDLGSGWRDHYDAVAVPLFHLAEVAGISSGLERVLELNFLPAPAALRRIAMVDPGRDVVVMQPTARGVERMTSLVRQYYPGTVVPRHGGLDSLAETPDDAVVVTTHAIGITPEQEKAMPDVIVVDWELDQLSASTFAERVEAAGR